MIFDTTQRALEAALHGATVRQSALAANIANVNTPGYRRQDVDFQGALAAALDDGAGAVDRLRPTATVDGSAAVRQDGNSVDLEVEATSQATNGMVLQAVTSVMRARIDIVKSAMGVS